MNMDIGLEPLYGRELILPGEQSIEGRIRIFEGCVNRKAIDSPVEWQSDGVDANGLKTSLVCL
jgi:hypothetical protein